MPKLLILITVILDNTAPVTAPVLKSAASVLDGLLRPAKIGTIWIEVDPLSAAMLPGPPLAFHPQRNITLRLVQSEPRELPSAALAYAELSASSAEVTILFRRVMELSRVREVETGTLLGYVIAHEIVHVLLQRRTHGPWGLMADQWRAREFSMMRNYSLRFDARDAELMRAALESSACGYSRSRRIR